MAANELSMIPATVMFLGILFIVLGEGPLILIGCAMLAVGLIGVWIMENRA
jgi:hypothetical protein